MADLLRRAQRSASEHHLLPAALSHRTVDVSYMSTATLFAWTFGSGAVVCGTHHSYPFPNTVWAIVLEDMAGCVDVLSLCHG
jgi:hypothetical protein